MARINTLKIYNYRSIGPEITINFPKNMPVILIGENNSGKTNIIRALDILFGESHPKYKNFEDHDFYERNPNNEIKIQCEVSEFNTKLGRNLEYECRGFILIAQRGKENQYVAIQNNNIENSYISKELREELNSILIESSQNLSYHLSYSSKYTLLSKVTKSFHEKLISDEKKVKEVKDLYSKIISIFDEVEGFKEFKKGISSVTENLIKNMTYRLNIDFSVYDPSNYFKNLRVQPKENEEIRNFDELGTGQQQILALSFAFSYAKNFMKGLIFIIDEPEKHLHPLAQKWLAKNLFQIAESGLQIIIVTHSPYFINLKYLESIYLVKKERGATCIVNTNEEKLYRYCQAKGASKAKPETIVPFYNKNATPHILQGFFSNKIILVEGLTEEIALPVYLEKAGLDLLKEGIEIINVGGKGELPKWWRFFTHYQIRVYVIFDNDRKDDKKGNKRKDLLETIGIESARINNLTNSDAWYIEDLFCIFGKDFEKTLRDTFKKYIELENIIKDELGDAKPLVAREVAIRLTTSDNYDETDTGWEKIKNLCTQIKNL